MKTIHLVLPSFLLAASAVIAPARAEQGAAYPERRVADPAAPAVTADNLLDSERFWPYQVALREPWQPPGRPYPIQPDVPGVLIRVESGGRARVDFGRDGLHLLAVAQTDLLERANQVRVGRLEKQAPNFVLAIAPRLLDPAAEVPAPFSVARVTGYRAFLCVFADLEALAELEPTLAPLAEREGVLTIVFPQGQQPDPVVRARLRELGWTPPFVYDHLSEPYTRTLLEPGVRLPAILLQTAEGRVLLERSWDPATPAALARALDAGPVSGR